MPLYFLVAGSKRLAAAVTAAKSYPSLTHYRPAMPFGNSKKYFRGFFQFSFATD